jgi:phosphoenolpyruvate carboxylase
LAIVHALRIALLQQIWLLATHIPEFSPQRGTTADELIQRIIHLDVETVVTLLGEIFPLANANEQAGEDFGEEATYLADSRRSYAREHVEIFEPISRIFALVRRIASVITYHAGAVG